MPDELTVVTLPDSDELLLRLKAASSEPHRIERLYPIILRNAGRQMYSTGIVIMLQLAFYDYTVDLPPIINIQLQMDIDNYISAILIDNEVACSEALLMMEEARSK